MIKFILGRCGSGKSQKLREIIKNKIDSGEEKIILIVPEQSSFCNEKKMLEVLGDKNFNKIHVLSFSRLYDFVCGILNIPTFIAPEETRKIVMMSAAVQSVKTQLKLYKKCCDDASFAPLILETAKEFKINKLDFAAMEKISNLCKKNTLKQKIHEIKLIITAYESIAKSKFEDSFNGMGLLEKVITSHRVFQGYNIFFDEFSSFTPEQSAILELLSLQAENVYIAMCCNENYKNTSSKNLFSCIAKTIRKIEKIAEKNHTPVDKPTFLSKASRFRSIELEILEKNIFNSQKCHIEYPTSNIQIYNALDQTEECEQVALTIKKLVMEKGYRYREFAVLTRNIDDYSGIIKNVFKRYEIPYFLDTSEKIFGKSLINLIFAVLGAITGNFDTSEILRLLKCGLSNLSAEDTAKVENYCLLWDIKSNDWINDFLMHPEGFSKKWEQKDIAELQKINALRKKIICPLQRLSQSTQKANGEELSRAVYNYLIETNVPENLRRHCATLFENGHVLQAQQEAKIWDSAMNLLDEMSYVFKDRKISPKKYTDILMSAANSINLSSIPQTVDNVVVGCANRVRLSDPKIVFIIGAVNGEFPKTPEPFPIFSEAELSQICALDIMPDVGVENFLVQERFLAYVAISNASQKLFVSWPSSNTSGKGNLPSEIITEIKAIFPKAKILNRHNFAPEETVWSIKPGFEIYAQNSTNASTFASELKKYYFQSKNYVSKCLSLQRFVNKTTMHFENPLSAKKIVGENLRLSASQIEKYYTCPFGYFCEYVLKAKPQNPARFGAPEYGNIIHHTLEKLFKKYPQKEILKTPFEEIQKEITSITDDYIQKNLGGFKEKPQRFLYIIERLKYSLEFLLQRLQEEFSQSLFSIADAELEISQKGDVPPLSLRLPGGEKVIVEGKIDRVDIMPGENGTYVRIVDYKTGAKELKLSEVLYGLNTQMLIYIATLQKNGNKKYGKVIPAGILYFTALKPLVDAAMSCTPEAEEKKVSKKLCMNGLIIDDIVSARAMETDGKGIFIPVEIKNNEIKKSRFLTTLKELEIIEKHIKKSIETMATNLQNGEIAPAPICNKHIACEWCEYFAICRYEKETFIEIPINLDNKEALEKMKEYGDENHG